MGPPEEDADAGPPASPGPRPPALDVAPDLRIPLAEIELRASRSSGPGGQHANVTASRVEAVFEIARSSALTGEQRELLLSRLGPRATAVSQDARSQARNRELALQRLADRIGDALHVDAPRQRTRPSRGVRERRERERRRAQQRKASRRPPRAEDD